MNLLFLCYFLRQVGLCHSEQENDKKTITVTVDSDQIKYGF